MLERGREVELLRARCAAAAQGRGGVVVVAGVPGIGKTELLAAARRAGERSGLLVLSAAGTELERGLALGVVRQLFERHVREHDPQPPLSDAAALGAATLLDAATPGQGSETVQHRLYWLAAELAARRPLLLAVDDAQWADLASQRWLAYLGRRLDGVPALLVLARREPASPQPTPLDHVAAHPDATVLRPAALSVAGVGRCLRRRLGRAASPAFARACHRVSGGNPLLVRELTTVLLEDGTLPEDGAADRVAAIAPANVTRSVRLRLAPLGPDALRLAEAVAVLSRDARLDRVAALAGLPLPRTAALADELRRLDVLAPADPPAFRHPILRAAVYEQIPPGRRALTHLAAAHRLLDEGLDPEHAASHLLHAPPSGSAAVVAALQAAAAAAAARGAPETAAQLLRRALLEPPADRADVLFALALVESTTQDPAAAEHALAVVDTAPPGPLAARAVLVAAQSLTYQRRFDEAITTLARLDDVLGDADPESRKLALVQRLLLPAWQRGIAHFDAELRRAGVDGLAGDTPSEVTLLALRVLEMVLTGRAPSADAIELARRLLPKVDPEAADELTPLMLGRSLTILDAFEEGRALLAAVMDAARRRGEVNRITGAGAMLAELEYRSGRLQWAEVIALEALASAPADNAGLNVPAALAFLVDAVLEREGPEAALAVPGQHGFGPDEFPLGYTGHILRWAVGRAHAAASHLEVAETHLRGAGEALAGWGDVNPANISWRSDLALVLDRLDRPADAEALAEEELRLARRFGTTRAVGVALRARALLESGADRVRRLREAEQVLAAGPARLEHARVLVDLGTALRHTGARTEARVVLATGLDAASACGARRLADRARAELVAAGARPRRERLSGVQALTASELRVSELAAQGLTNRQIAQTLFLSTKTVEMHLSRAYPKLGVSGRGELAAALG